MKKKPLNRFDLKRIFAVMLDTCLTKKSSAFFMAFSTLLVAACSPKTSNYYNNPNGAEQSQQGNAMSGGANGAGNGGSTGDGGGGQGVLCGNTKDPKIRNQLFVRDIYEAIYNHGRQMKTVPTGDSPANVSAPAISILTTSIQQVFGPASIHLDFAQDKYWNTFTKKISFLDEKRKLFTSQDANSPIALPDECQLVQIAYWDESAGNEDDGTLYISKPLWEKLDGLNKIGLLAHEFFFKKARQAGARNSDLVRFKVGQMLSDSPPSSIFKYWNPSSSVKTKAYLPHSTKGYKFCEGTSRADSTARLQFYQYEGTDKNQHLVFPLLESKTINLNPLQAGHFLMASDPVWMTLKRMKNADDFDKLILVQMLQNYPSFHVPDIAGISSDKLLRWYFDGTGLIGRPHVEYKGVFQELVKKSSHEEPDYWKGKIETIERPILISFPNPRYDQNAKDEPKILKSPDELINALNLRIRNILYSCPNLRVPGEITASAIARLNAEVSEAVKNGSYLGWEDWKSFLSTIQKHVLTDSDLEKDPDYIEGTPKYSEEKCNYLKNKNLTVNLPFYIYLVRSNNYSERDMVSALQTDAYQPRNLGASLTIQSDKIVPKAIVSQNNKNIEFELSCKDALTIYKQQEIKNVPAEIGLTPNKDLIVNYSYHDEKYRGETPNENLKLLGTYLSSSDSSLENLYQILNSCGASDGMLFFNCSDYRIFASELKKEKTIRIRDCMSANFKDDETNASCAVVDLKESEHSYVVRYLTTLQRKEQNSSLTSQLILHVRLIPPVELQKR